MPYLGLPSVRMTFYFSFDLFFAFVGFYRIYGACVAGVKREGEVGIWLRQNAGDSERWGKRGTSRVPLALSLVL